MMSSAISKCGATLPFIQIPVLYRTTKYVHHLFAKLFFDRPLSWVVFSKLCCQDAGPRVEAHQVQSSAPGHVGVSEL